MNNRISAIYEQVIATQVYKTYEAAQNAVNELMQQVNATIQYEVTGQTPCTMIAPPAADATEADGKRKPDKRKGGNGAVGLSPMMQQYMSYKEQYKDALLFFRLGDFYEMFFEDAKTASRELGLTLTGRDCGEAERAPMCGVPYHAADTYIGRLVAKGYKVVICEQMEDPATAKGIVRRDVVRIVTARDGYR